MLIFKYTKLSNLISTLENGIFASDPSTLNDPYETYGIDTSGLRICCLSKSQNAKLMWSHYADGHRGCSIGIEVPNNFDELNGLLHFVKYTNYAECNRQTDRIERLFCKDKKWNYEKEVRAIYDSNNYDSNDWKRKSGKVFLKVSIKRVAFGSSVDLTSSDFITSLLWIKRFNDNQKHSKDRIEVIKYIACDDGFRFKKDLSFNYEEILNNYPRQ